MNTISLTPRESVARVMRTPAKPLAEKAAEFLTSVRLTMALAPAGIIAVLLLDLGTTHPLRCAAVFMAFALQACAALAADINKKGGEL